MPRLTCTLAVPTIPGREKLLARALETVERQTRRPDRTAVLVDTERKGAAHARNQLVDACETDVILWLDDDDFLKDNHVRTLMRVLEREPEVDLVYPTPVVHAPARMMRGVAAGVYPAAVTHQGRFPVSPWGLRWSQELEAHLRHAGSFIPITHAVRTEAVRKAGGFPPPQRLEGGRLRGEDEGYLIALLDTGARFEHIGMKTWHWNAMGGGTAGLGYAERERLAHHG